MKLNTQLARSAPSQLFGCIMYKNIMQLTSWGEPGNEVTLSHSAYPVGSWFLVNIAPGTVTPLCIWQLKATVTYRSEGKIKRIVLFPEFYLAFYHLQYRMLSRGLGMKLKCMYFHAAWRENNTSEGLHVCMCVCQCGKLNKADYLHNHPGWLLTSYFIAQSFFFLISPYLPVLAKCMWKDAAISALLKIMYQSQVYSYLVWAIKLHVHLSRVSY